MDSARKAWEVAMKAAARLRPKVEILVKAPKSSVEPPTSLHALSKVTQWTTTVGKWANGVGAANAMGKLPVSTTISHAASRAGDAAVALKRLPGEVGTTMSTTVLHTASRASNAAVALGKLPGEVGTKVSTTISQAASRAGDAASSAGTALSNAASARAQAAAQSTRRLLLLAGGFAVLAAFAYGAGTQAPHAILKYLERK